MFCGDVREHAVRAAVEVAATHGIRECDPSVVADGFNVLVRLSPAPVIARVMTVTSILRPSQDEHIAREISVAEFLASRGIPVVRPTRDLAPGPHRYAGCWLSFWEDLGANSGQADSREADSANNGETSDATVHSGYIPSAAVAGARLADLHRALRDYPGCGEALDVPRSDIETFLRVGGNVPFVDSTDLERLRHRFERVLARIDTGTSSQCLHGDAHPGNLLRANGDWVWTDFEESAFGPVEWDLACLRDSRRIDGAAALRAYGAADSAVLTPFRELRQLQAAAWLSVIAAHSSEYRDRAREVLDGLA